MPLTDKACSSAKPSEKSRKISDSHGLYLEIMPNGSKLWRLKYRFGGKEKRLALGSYPLDTLAQVREKRDSARKLLALGQDPGEVKKVERRVREAEAHNTFEQVAREWHSAKKAAWSPRYAETLLQRLESDLFPALKGRPIAQIGAPELLTVIRSIQERGANEIAFRALQTCGVIFRYGIATSRCEKNPASDLKGALHSYKKGHHAAIDSAELPHFLRRLDLNEARLYRHTILSIHLLMRTFVRTSELIQAEWKEIDLIKRTWIIPPERMKMRKGHIVPLSHQCIGILLELKKLAGDQKYVFPSQVKKKQTHMSNNTILKALERMDYKGQMTGHGFRALAMSTIMEELGYRHEVVDRQLAHARKSEVDAAYDRAEFLADRKLMMQEWSDYLDKIRDQRSNRSKCAAELSHIYVENEEKRLTHPV